MLVIPVVRIKMFKLKLKKKKRERKARGDKRKIYIICRDKAEAESGQKSERK